MHVSTRVQRCHSRSLGLWVDVLRPRCIICLTCVTTTAAAVVVRARTAAIAAPHKQLSLGCFQFGRLIQQHSLRAPQDTPHGLQEGELVQSNAVHLQISEVSKKQPLGPCQLLPLHQHRPLQQVQAALGGG